MISLLRIVGILMIIIGLLLMASWFVEPLRQLWPWLLALPWPIRIGLVISGFGLLVMIGTVIYERLHADDGSLFEEELGEDQ
ncbi:MAG: hypothetical protein RQ741_02150 [Wenzhouxiangellaceae bacterium]|nr:hypothetical protein [Wenzhouxiangellaceae bacterium]